MTRSGRTPDATHPGPATSLGGGRDVHFFQDFQDFQERIHMLMPHPVVLRGLVEEYEALMAREGGGEAGKGLRAQDLAYTLCVSTGTREVGQALATARRLLAAARDPEEPAIAG
ncbi:DUF5133 domain-containing protein [Streptomyces viridochromogenes]|uniref:DUF5133 domain-containing protein n=1 Tax=Streptomyces viridochromogenes Tue57 TaxID=1160705 RepID=L8P2J3_STRVR|nr:DUF5133 domain-containing protein [Streptomyces viridochromogenes]ELS50389.1 hypothetical protein STVIR_8627 [Streptomyces viridochromogenes Tue57]